MRMPVCPSTHPPSADDGTPGQLSMSFDESKAGFLRAAQSPVRVQPMNALMRQLSLVEDEDDASEADVDLAEIDHRALDAAAELATMEKHNFKVRRRVQTSLCL